ncbi:ABC transporter ATP-binding protein [Actinosynnema sp. NPDC002837]
MISVRDVGKVFGAATALQGVTFDLEPGIVALLGRNGAGKSTLLGILAGLAVESSGVIAVDGAPLAADRRALRAAATLLPQDPRLDPEVSAKALLRYLLTVRGLDTAPIEGLLDRFGLGGALGDRAIGTLSGGMRQRVGLVYAFATETRMLLLDEPTTGLDPWERLRFTSHLAHAATNATIVYSTHVVSDIEAIANRVLVLERGRLIFDGSPDVLVSMSPPVFVAEGDESTAARLHGSGALTAVTRVGPNRYRVRFLGESLSDEAKQVEPTLNDAYIALTRSAA